VASSKRFKIIRLPMSTGTVTWNAIHQYLYILLVQMQDNHIQSFMEQQLATFLSGAMNRQDPVLIMRFWWNFQIHLQGHPPLPGTEAFHRYLDWIINLQKISIFNKHSSWLYWEYNNSNWSSWLYLSYRCGHPSFIYLVYLEGQWEARVCWFLYENDYRMVDLCFSVDIEGF
jgi:hypothetical protein